MEEIEEESVSWIDRVQGKSRQTRVTWGESHPRGIGRRAVSELARSTGAGVERKQAQYQQGHDEFAENVHGVVPQVFVSEPE